MAPAHTSGWNRRHHPHDEGTRFLTMHPPSHPVAACSGDHSIDRSAGRIAVARSSRGWVAPWAEGEFANEIVDISRSAPPAERYRSSSRHFDTRAPAFRCLQSRRPALDCPVCAGRFRRLRLASLGIFVSAGGLLDGPIYDQCGRARFPCPGLGAAFFMPSAEPGTRFNSKLGPGVSSAPRRGEPRAALSGFTDVTRPSTVVPTAVRRADADFAHRVGHAMLLCF